MNVFRHATKSSKACPDPGTLSGPIYGARIPRKSVVPENPFLIGEAYLNLMLSAPLPKCCYSCPLQLS